MTLPSIAPRRPTARVERYETVVIGAGQAGLAVGHCLAKRDVDFVILGGVGAAAELLAAQVARRCAMAA